MIEQVLSRLSETVQWCAPRANVLDPDGSLRSPELRPPEGTRDWAARVEVVCVARATTLASMPRRQADPTSGRLLIFDPGQSLSDGAAMVESNGFFDADNEPPWDTWIAYVQERPQRPGAWTHLDSYLICWIPPAFLDLVDRAIAVNPEECLLWTDTVQTPFLVRLREHLDRR